MKPLSLSIDIRINKPHFKLHAQCQIEWLKPAIHVLFGSSGCGKSHLLRAIAGLEPCLGNIEFQGVSWQDTAKRIHRPCHRRNVGVVFQDSQLFSHLNVQGNLQFAFKRSAAQPQDWQQVIAALDLQPLLHKSARQLSGGEKQRVSLARTLLSKPDLLLMDEPLASLDWHSRQEIMRYLRHICERWQLPILYVSHNLDEVMQLAERVILLNKQGDESRIEKIGPLVELLQEVQHGFNQAAKAGSIIDGTLLDHDASQDENRDINQVKLLQQVLYTPVQAGLRPGPIRLCIQASDVSLCLSQPKDSSILNIMPVKIVAIISQDNGESLIKLNLDGQSLLSRISRHSLLRLNLEVGQVVFAQIKAVALQR
ncbi:MAG: molybdenum ABC transporter ATP-binding protein, partial [Bermanella sp.]